MQGYTTCGSLAAGLWENGERMRKWRVTRERMGKWKEIYSLHFLTLFPFPDKRLSHFVGKCQVRHFCRECHKKLKIRAMRKSFLRESSASYEGLRPAANYFWLMAVWFLLWGQGTSFKYAITEYKKSFWQSPEIDWILPIDARISSRAASSRGMVLSRINAPLSIIHSCIIHNP